MAAMCKTILIRRGSEAAIVAVLAATLAVTAGGCGGSGAPVYPAGGRVEFADGTPMNGGSVSFRPVQVQADASARGQIRADGTFSLTTFSPDDGAALGRHRVLVVAALVGDRETPNPAQTPQLDPRNSNYDTSGLEFDVTNDPAKNEFTIVVGKRG